MASFPIIDGHFWVVRDDKIIDPDFDEYHLIKEIQGCVGKRVYLPADDLVQRIIKRKFESMISVEECGTMFSQYFRGRPQMNSCFQNACMEINRNGGELVFGSMGWKKRSGGIHYEFGGEGWTVSQFLK